MMLEQISIITRRYFLSLVVLSLLLQASSVVVAKQAAVVAEVKVNPTVPDGNHKLLGSLAIGKRFRDALVDSRTFDMYSRDAAELQSTIRRERELAESGLAKTEGQPDFRYNVAAYFFAPEVVRFSAYSSFSPIPYVNGVYKRADTAILNLRVAVLDSSGKILFEESVEDSSRVVREHVAEVRPKGGRPPLSQLKKLASGLVRRIMDALMTRINPITIYARDGDSVRIDRGHSGGLKKGAELLVYSSPEEWTNPNTGETRRFPGKQVGEVRITRVYVDMAEAKIIQDKGIQPNFTLRFK